MTFTGCFRFSSYGLIVAGLLAIASTGEINPLATAATSAVVVASWFVDTAALGRRIPRSVQNLLALSFLAFFAADYRWLSHSFIAALVHLVFLFTALKLLLRTSDRDYLYLYAVSFAQLLAASALTVDISFAAALCLYLCFAVSTLILYEMKRSAALAQTRTTITAVAAHTGPAPGELELFSPFPVRTVFWISVGTATLILVLAVPLFLVLPRLALGVYRRPAGRMQMVSGFSDRVELGQIGSISESDAVVMRVRMNRRPDAVPPSLKFRGIALDHYDGRAWSRSNTGRARLVPREGYFKLDEYKQADSELLYQTFFLEAVNTDVVFASHKLLAVSDELRFLQKDRAGSLFTALHPSQKIRYTAVSEPVRVDPTRFPAWSVPVPLEVRECCLQLPRGDPRIGELAARVAEAAPGPYGKTRLLESWLRSNYAYSLDLGGRPDHPDPLARFLFEEKRGHCEYFATALALMLRHLGVPSRVVNGFRAGEHNSLTDAWTVRQYDAHSWVEAYLAPYGWLEFDATPPAPRRKRTTLLHAAVQFLDMIGLYWSEEVINYDVWKQFRMFFAARNAAAEAAGTARRALLLPWERIRRGAEALSTEMWNPVSVVLATAFLAAIGIAIRNRRAWMRRLRRLLHRKLHSREPAVLLRSSYAEALEILESAGRKKDPSQTALEFSRTLAPHPAAEPFGRLTNLYHQVRFGGQNTPEAQATALMLVRHLRESLARRPL